MELQINNITDSISGYKSESVIVFASSCLYFEPPDDLLSPKYALV
jgi:hypothetical protein